MLQITTERTEFFNEDTNEFVYVQPQKLILEHSLLSVSKWEAKWKKPFLTKDDKTPEELLDYIRCMTINQNVNPLVYNCLTRNQLKAVENYIGDKASATVIRTANTPHGSGRAVTSELIYYWMTAQNIPFECEKWHLNRLLTLIKVANIENNPKKKKMGRRDIYNQNRALNAARRARHNTKG